MRRKGTKDSLVRYFTELTPAGREMMCLDFSIPRSKLAGSALNAAEAMADWLAAGGNVRVACNRLGC